MSATKKQYFIVINALTLSRIPLTILFVVFCISQANNLLQCCMIFIMIIFTDLLDGKLARKYKVTSEIGARLDISCDFFFIIFSCMILCIKNIMSIFLPIIISLKFLEFLITSHWMKCVGHNRDLLFFDPFGRLLAALFYCIPIIVIFITHSFPGLQTALIAAVTVLTVISSLLRIYSCIHHEA